MIRVAHLITGTQEGGMEGLLHRLAAALDPRRFSSRVFGLTPDGPVADRLKAAGTPVVSFSGKNPVRLWREVRAWLAAAPTDLVHTWMPHADLLGGLAARWTGGPPVVWSTGQSNLGVDVNRWSTLAVQKLCAALSGRLPAAMVCVGRAARDAHARFGYRAECLRVIPNGIDAEAFRPDPAARERVLRRFGLPPGSFLVGMGARFDPQKDHATFLEALARVLPGAPGVRALLWGAGVTPENRRLKDRADRLGVGSAVSFLGHQPAVAELTAGLDLFVSASCGEGFSTVIGEAMGCGVPCVVTDVGDSAFLVGDPDRVVPPRSPAALADGILRVRALPADARAALGRAARRRVLEHFSLQGMVARYENLYEEVAGQAKNAGRAAHG